MSEVLTCSRFVQDYDRGSHYKDAGNGDSLFLSEGKSAYRPGSEGVESTDLQSLIDPFVDFFFGVSSVHYKPQGHFVPYHGLCNHLVGVLHYICYLLSPFFDGKAGNIFSVDIDGTFTLFFKTADDFTEAALTGSVTSYDTHHLSLSYGEVDVLESFLSVGIAERQVLGFQ